jgi:hypothetical protein
MITRSKILIRERESKGEVFERKLSKTSKNVDASRWA